MKIITRLIATMTLTFFASVTLAAPGEPIGGIIVKGGKNPGGQMLVLATTDASGKFTIPFAEGGEYRLEFVSKTQADINARMKAGMQLDYSIKTNSEVAADAQQPSSKMSRQTPFHNKIENAQLLITVPNGGGAVSGTLQVDNSLEQDNTTERAINESGVSVKSTSTKGGIKH